MKEWGCRILAALTPSIPLSYVWREWGCRIFAALTLSIPLGYVWREWGCRIPAALTLSIPLSYVWREWGCRILAALTLSILLGYSPELRLERVRLPNTRRPHPEYSPYATSGESGGAEYSPPSP